MGSNDVRQAENIRKQHPQDWVLVQWLDQGVTHMQALPPLEGNPK